MGFRWDEHPGFRSVRTRDRAEPLDCCPIECRFVEVLEANYCYYCNLVLSRANNVACFYENDGICASVYPDQQLCTDGVYCPYDKTYPCGYIPPGPTPTPSPSPTPTAPPCNPAEKPNNTNCLCDTLPYIIAGAPPQWSCNCISGTGADYNQPRYKWIPGMSAEQIQQRKQLLQVHYSVLS